MPVKPHISHAVRQLRVWVTLAAVVVGLAAGTQMLVFGFANYTEVRWTDPRPQTVDRNLSVVGSGVAAHTLSRPSAELPPPVRTLSAADTAMRRISTAAVGLGSLGAVALAVFCFLGVIVAGGGQIPGVERTVTACAWSLALAMLCLPWADVFPSIKVPGVFVGYAAMTRAIDSGNAGLPAIAQWVAMPAIAFVVCVLVAAWFHLGVQRGVIITAPSELDRAVEKEMENIQRRGMQHGTSRSVGALHRAIGESAPSTTQPDLESVVEEAAASIRRISTEAQPVRSASGARVGGRSVVDEDYKRPI